MAMRAIIVATALVASAVAFSPAHNGPSSYSLLFRPKCRVARTQLNAAATIPNPLKKLPWNAKKEKEREARRMKQESAKLHRELGIPEDATYEELTEATDALIRKAGGDRKKVVKIEITKDRIMQIRLNERLAGLATETAEARAASNEDMEDDEEDEETPVAKEWNAPRWTQNLVVKPDEEWRNKCLFFWGGLTALVWMLPPVAEPISMLAFLFTVGSLTWRGVPNDGGEYQMISGRRSRPHSKVAWLLGVTLWFWSKIGAAVFVRRVGVYGSPFDARVQTTIGNLVLGVACMYLQPYNGDKLPSKKKDD